MLRICDLIEMKEIREKIGAKKLVASMKEGKVVRGCLIQPTNNAGGWLRLPGSKECFNRQMSSIKRIPKR